RARWRVLLPHQVRSAARSLALRALGFWRNSRSPATSGFFVSGRRRSSARKAALMRSSSSEWKLMTTNRPPGRSRCGAAARRRSGAVGRSDGGLEPVRLERAGAEEQEPAAGAEPIRGGGEGAVENREHEVDADPGRLEGPGRRFGPVASGAVGPADEVGELG